MGSRPQLASPESLANLEAARRQILQSLAPPPSLKVSEWADLNRFLPRGTSANWGQWRTESFQREMMDAVHEPGVREIVFMTSTQIVKSEALNNIVGYFIDAEPKAIMMVQPTDGDAKKHSKMRIAPMIAACPALYRKVRQATTRQPGNTILLKEFDGGFLKLVGANAGTGLRGDPIEILLEDEIDAYPDDVDGEGDPIEIVERRTDSFTHAIIVKGSTPARPRGFSKIEAAYQRSDERRYYVPCPFCRREQILTWRDAAGTYRLVWDKNPKGEPLPESVRYLCAGCGKGIEERYKFRMLAEGRWIAAHPEIKDVIGFTINALYSPWRMNWADLAKQWHAAQHNREKLRAFVNLRLAETWDENAVSSIGAHELRQRVEIYGVSYRIQEDGGIQKIDYFGESPPPEASYRTVVHPMPSGICVLVATADVQNDRIEAQITGFGPGEECWLVAYEIFWGNPAIELDPEAAATVWKQLDDFFLKSFTHPSGIELSPAVCLIDSGAHSDSVYDFVIPRQNSLRRVFACKGERYLSKPGLIQEGTTKRGNVRQFLIATYAAKDRIFGRMGIPQAGPGYLHLPEWVTDEYLNQLTGEKKIPVTDRRTRTTKYIYVKTQERNEALDNMVYAHGALAVLQQFVAPAIYRDLAAVHAILIKGQRPESLAPPRIRRMRTAPILTPALM